MTKVPSLEYKKVFRALQRDGWVVVRQKGSHRRLQKHVHDETLKLTIIINIEETKRLGTFEQFIEDSGLEEFIPNILSARKELVGFTPIEIPF